MKTLFLLILLTFVFGERLNKIEYGSYCILTSDDTITTMGGQPVGNLDRFCQIYDVCIASNFNPCYCEEQLYYYVSNLSPTTDESTERDKLLHNAYMELASCSTNYFPLQDNYVISTFNQKNLGYWYIPFYPIFYDNHDIGITLKQGSLYYFISHKYGITEETYDKDLILREISGTMIIETNGSTIVFVNYDNNKIAEAKIWYIDKTTKNNNTDYIISLSVICVIAAGFMISTLILVIKLKRAPQKV
jgi:hypothetical protein